MTRNTETDPPSIVDDVRSRTLQAMAKASSDPHPVWGDEVRSGPKPSDRPSERSPKPEPALKDRWPQPSGKRSGSPIAILAGVIALVAVLVGSLVMFSGNSSPAAGPQSQGAPTTADEVPDTAPAEVPLLRPIADAAQPVLGAGFTTEEAGDVDADAAPPAGAGCAPSHSGVTPTSSYQRSWTLRDVGDNVTANLVIRLSEFADPADVLNDIKAEQSLASLPCAASALEAQMPGTSTELVGPRPIELGDAGAAYRLVSRDAGAIVMVTDVLIVSRGRLQATVTAARCCEGFGIDNERTLTGSLLAEMDRAQDLPVHSTTANAADGPFLSEGADPLRLVTEADLAAVGLTQAQAPSGIVHADPPASSARWTAGAVVVEVTSAGPDSVAVPSDLGTPISGLGDSAGWQPDDGGGTVNVRVGEQFLAIAVDGLPQGEARSMAEELAGLAVPRVDDLDG